MACGCSPARCSALPRSPAERDASCAIAPAPCGYRVRQIARASRSRVVQQGQERLKACYRKLLYHTARVVGQAKRFAEEIATGRKRARGLLKQIRLQAHRAYLERMIPLVRQVMHQTRERIFKGNTHVPGKLVSLFEPHTEVIRKGKAAKPTEFGKMVKIQEAEAQIVTHYEVYAERPVTAICCCRRSPCMKNSWVAALSGHRRCRILLPAQ